MALVHAVMALVCEQQNERVEKRPRTNQFRNQHYILHSSCYDCAYGSRLFNCKSHFGCNRPTDRHARNAGRSRYCKLKEMYQIDRFTKLQTGSVIEIVLVSLHYPLRREFRRTHAAPIMQTGSVGSGLVLQYELREFLNNEGIQRFYIRSIEYCIRLDIY